MRKELLIGMMVMLLASCAESVEVAMQYANADKIVLGADVPELSSTRGAAIEAREDITTLGLFGLVYPAAQAAANSEYYQTVAPGDYIFNGKVEQQYPYWPTSYIWPGAANNISLYAYAPYATDDNGITIASTSSQPGGPTIRYTTPELSDNHPDLIVGESEKNIAGDKKGVVPIPFEHVLARVQITAGSEGMPAGTISNIWLRQVETEGLYTIGGTGEWTTTGTIGNVKATSMTSTGAANEDLATTTKTFFMIPQDLDASTEEPMIQVDYAGYRSIYQNLTGKWEAGQTYVYELTNTQALIPTLPIGTTFNFDYTGNVQEFTATAPGRYQIECWGASGGNSSDSDGCYGRGSYVSGQISFEEGEVLYVYVGQQGTISNYTGAWNGGGYKGQEDSDGSGGGSTDVRTKKGLSISQSSSWTTAWDNTYGLRGRIIVAAGGGGSDDRESRSNWSGDELRIATASGGGLTSISCDVWRGANTGATQTSGGSYVNYPSREVCNGGFGCANQSGYSADAGGGGGYWGGAASDACGMGGSCFISGHEGCVAIANANGTSPKVGVENSVDLATHYSGFFFINTVMIDGAGYQWTTEKSSLMQMPKPSGGNYPSKNGHTGNGYCRITYLGI